MTERARVLVTTELAATAVGVAPDSFRTWARRRNIRAVRHERRGRSTVALWDVNEVYDATRGKAPSLPVLASSEST